VQTLKHQVEANKSEKDKRAALADPNSKEARAKKKAEEEERQRELNEIFVATIKQPKVPAGVDPKSIVCEFFRKGACQKGFKCKFSHDLAVERKTAKADLYSDRRAEETMEDWDQEKLEAAIAEQQGKHNINRPTDIICKHFLDAIEKKQYGWFWQCPGGGEECKYRHALPPGYVLKSQIKALAAEAAANKKTLEEELEEQRTGLSSKASTPVTEEVFQAWKRRKLAARAAAADASRGERERLGRLSGRELTESGFTFEDDEDAGGGGDYAREDDEEAVFAAAAAAAQRAQAAAQAAKGQPAEQPVAMSESLAAALEGLGDEGALGEEELADLERALQETELET